MAKLYKQLYTDILITLVVYTFSAFLHSGGFSYTFSHYFIPASVYYTIHILLSLARRKYEDKETYSFAHLSRIYVNSWMSSTGLILLAIVVFRIDWISRQVLLTNIFGLITLESVYIITISLFRQSVQIKDPDEIDSTGVVDVAALYPSAAGKEYKSQKELVGKVIKRSGDELFNYITGYIDISQENTLALNTDSIRDIMQAPADYYHNIVNLHKINNIRYINKFMEAANSRLPVGGLLVVNAETKNQRKTRFLERYPPILNYIIYTMDFVLMRILPKIPVGKKVYFFFTKGRRRVLSRAEILGRLISCGYEIVEDRKMLGRIYVVARKVRLPAFNNDASYGPLIYLNRVGKGGKTIRVYKLRTMHPFSEYLQEYVFEKNSICKGGKLKDDFRVATIGRFLRRWWLDELPMLYNLIAGDIKLVGVRPLSRHYFSLYTPELQKRRTRYKPGLVPPFYMDMPHTLEEIQASEMKYLDEYEKAPFKTDLRYLFGALYNIVFRRARSA